MATPANTSTTTDINFALDTELINNFRNDYNKLAEILGIITPEVMTAGTTLNQLKITGTLNNAKAADSSSGTAYVEGDLVALSKFTAKKVPIETIKVEPYRKTTTADAILRSGYEVAVLGTDRKMLSVIRNSVLGKFMTGLDAGTGAATGKTLQATLAMADAELEDKLEDNSDSTERVIHFVNRKDAAEYIGNAAISTQNAFGMTYLESFLGITDVFLTSKVEKGKPIVTPVENIRAYGLDFANLASSGLSYESDSNGLIGVSHVPAYNYVSAETNIIVGARFVPEVLDYIVKGTIAPGA